MFSENPPRLRSGLTVHHVMAPFGRWRSRRRSDVGRSPPAAGGGSARGIMTDPVVCRVLAGRWMNPPESWDFPPRTRTIPPGTLLACRPGVPRSGQRVVPGRKGYPAWRPFMHAVPSKLAGIPVIPAIPAKPVDEWPRIDRPPGAGPVRQGSRVAPFALVRTAAAGEIPWRKIPARRRTGVARGRDQSGTRAATKCSYRPYRQTLVITCRWRLG
jgi:hypothetical protein